MLKTITRLLTLVALLAFSPAVMGSDKKIEPFPGYQNLCDSSVVIEP